MVIYSLLLIVLMITRPQGLLGKTDLFKKWRLRFRGKRDGESGTKPASESAAEIGKGKV
jgi:hypothetical protein